MSNHGHNAKSTSNGWSSKIRMVGVRAFRSIDDWIYEHLARRTRVLFVLSDGYGFACQAPVIRTLLDFSDVLVRTTSDRGLSADQIEFANEKDRKLYISLALPTWRARVSKWHMVVDTHLNRFHPARNALRIFMHHGPAFGNTGNKYAVVRRYEIFCGLSHMEREWLDRLNPGIFGERHVFFSVGFPKSDALYKGSFNRNGVLSSLNLPDRPTILITSHWQKQSILRCLHDLPLGELARAFPHFNIIQTGHPWLWKTDHNIPEEWRNSLLHNIRKLQAHYPHIRFVQTSNVERLLVATDILVGDSSSVMTSFSLLDRPMIFFDNPTFQFAIPELKQIFVNASHPFSRIDELVPACQAAMAEPDAKAEGRAKMRETFYANEGRAGEYMAKLIRHIGRTCSPRGAKWEQVLSAAKDPDQNAMEVRPTNLS